MKEQGKSPPDQTNEEEMERLRERDKTQLAKLYDMKEKAADDFWLQTTLNKQIELVKDRERFRERVR